MKNACAGITLMMMMMLLSPQSLIADDYKHYFPLQLQNNWQYRYETTESIYALPDSIFDMVKYHGKLYYAWGDKREYPIYIHQDEQGRIYRRLGNQDLLWFDFTIDDGEQYTYSPDGKDGQMNVTVRKNRSLMTYAGQFDNCIEFFFDDPAVFADEQWYGFAPNIGIVKKQFAWVRMLLVSAQLERKTVTRVKATTANPVAGHALYQNYPNPFNATTFIKFALPTETSVTLDIYNIHGTKVRTLVSGRQAPGEYIVRWDGADNDSKLLQSGIYTYRLLTDEFTEMKRLVLLR
ncbi:T9SS type A sorting domain-containing protein [candidate division KSB1 bacterium]|nr:T9SS type A sorting domain-containing protein [candidate division KSB1 bacterium]